MKKTTKLIAPALGIGLVFGGVGVSASETITVEPGDTYWGLAQGYNDVTTKDILEENNYKPSAIPVGAEIIVPTDEENVVTHTIQPGNTLVEIASVYENVSVDDLIRLNPEVDPYSLTIGSELEVVDYDKEKGEDYLYHTVQPGNTFNEIASVYDGVTVDELIEANPNENPYELTIDSEIVVPLK